MIPRAVVTVDGVDVSCNVLTGVTIRHGRDGPTEQPEPATAQLQMFAPGRDVVDRLAINARLAVDAVFDDGTRLRRFFGLITDVDLSWDVVDRAMVRVLAASPVAILNRTFIGDEPWPGEIDGDRAERILSIVAPIPYLTTFATGLEGWYAVAPATAAWLPTAGINGQPVASITWGGTQPLPLQIFTHAITGLLPGATYTATAVVNGMDGGGFIAAQPGSVFGTAAPPGGGYVTISVTANADATGKIDVQFWPHAGAATNSKFRVAQVTVTAQHQIPLGQVDPGTLNVLARDVDRQPCLQLLADLADDAGGVAWHTRDGAICYADAEHRRNTPAAFTLDCGQVLMAPQWSHTTNGLVNDTTVTYGVDPGGGEQPYVRSTHPESITTYGRVALHQSTQLAAEVDAQQRADVTIARAALPVWNMPRVPVDLALPALDEAMTRALLTLEMHALITLTGLPNQGPATVVSLWVEGWDEKIDAYGTGGDWLLELSVTDYCRTSAFLRWDDVPDTITWDTADPDLTWDGVRCIGPIPNRGRWNDVAANERWDTVPASVTWDTWNQYVGAN